MCLNHAIVLIEFLSCERCSLFRVSTWKFQLHWNGPRVHTAAYGCQNFTICRSPAHTEAPREKTETLRWFSFIIFQSASSYPPPLNSKGAFERRSRTLEQAMDTLCCVASHLMFSSWKRQGAPSRAFLKITWRTKIIFVFSVQISWVSTSPMRLQVVWDPLQERHSWTKQFGMSWHYFCSNRRFLWCGAAGGKLSGFFCFFFSFSAGCFRIDCPESWSAKKKRRQTIQDANWPQSCCSDTCLQTEWSATLCEEPKSVWIFSVGFCVSATDMVHTHSISLVGQNFWNTSLVHDSWSNCNVQLEEKHAESVSCVEQEVRFVVSIWKRNWSSKALILKRNQKKFMDSYKHETCLKMRCHKHERITVK